MAVLATALRESFARRRVQTLTGQIPPESLTESFLAVRGGEPAPSTPLDRERASDLNTSPDIQGRIADLMDIVDAEMARRVTRTKSHLDRDELLAFLTRAVRAKPRELDEDCDLVQEMTTTEAPGGRITRKVKGVGKLEAGMLFARVSGWLDEGLGIPATLPGFERSLDGPGAALPAPMERLEAPAVAEAVTIPTHEAQDPDKQTAGP